MSGIKLMDLPPEEMLDVVHVLFEADYAENTPGQHDTRERVRRIIYNDLYRTPYRVDPGTSSASAGTADAGPAGTPSGGGARTGTKPYIPPTAPEDLSRVLGAPLG